MVIPIIESPAGHLLNSRESAAGATAGTQQVAVRLTLGFTFWYLL